MVGTVAAKSAEAKAFQACSANARAQLLSQGRMEARIYIYRYRYT